jgi:hypothetical protein
VEAVVAVERTRDEVIEGDILSRSCRTRLQVLCRFGAKSQWAEETVGLLFRDGSGTIIDGAKEASKEL